MKFLSCVAVAGSALVFGFEAAAANGSTAVAFNGSVDNDISKIANWGTGAAVDVESRYELSAPGDYVIGSDITLGYLHPITAGVYTFTGPGTLTLPKSMGTGVLAESNMTTVFSGVKMNLTGIYSAGNYAGWYVGCNGSYNTLVVTNGTQLTASDRNRTGWGTGHDNTTIVAGPTTVFTANGGPVQLGNQDCNNKIVFTDHATGSMSGQLNVGKGVNSASSTNNCVIAEDGADVTLGTLSIGAAGGIKVANWSYGENGLVVRSGANVKGSGVIELGAPSSAPGNFLIVSNATFNRTGSIVIGKESARNRFIVGDGASVTCGNVTVGQDYSANPDDWKCAHSNVMKVADRSVVYSSGDVVVGKNGSFNSLTVDGAKEFACAGTLYIGNAASSVSNVVTIKDTESLKLPGTVYIGYNGAYGNRMEVSHPTKFAPKVFVGHVNSCDNVLKVVSTEPFADEVYVGPRTTATGNRLVWECDAKYAGSMKLQFYDGNNQSGTGCGIELRKIDWDHGAANDGFKFFANSLGCTFKLADGARFTTKGGTNLERGNRIVIDGSTWDASYKNAYGACTVTIGNTGASNVLEVVNGGAFVFTNGSTFAVASTGTPLTNTFNRIIVGDRSKIVIANNFRINRACNEFVISNGTFQFGTEFLFPDVQKDRSKSTIALTNQIVRFYGANPRMVVTGANVYFPYQVSQNLEGEDFVRAGYNEFHFDIPAEGYAEPPIEATKAGGRVIFERTHRIFVTGDEFLKNGGKTMLARGNDASIGMTVHDLATLSSALPPKCKLVVKNNNELWLKAPSQGLMILLR